VPTRENAGASERASLRFDPRSHERYRETIRTDEPDDDLLPARLARCAGFGMGMRIGGAVKTFAR
jgi:hypothetical protein